MIEFGYDEFGSWYDEFRVDTLEPALHFARSALETELEELLSDRDLARIRKVAGRVKSKRRTWRKINQSRYSEQITRVDDIPEAIDDLVGLRITCTNLRDLEVVQAALDTLPASPKQGRHLGLDPATERDYVEAPKDSGYRGWHVNLSVNRRGVPVTCELQIRTLLQDSWGELTHEDTYSKAGELPPLVEILSKRMADLLATLDDIAEDLRSELDRIDEAVVDQPDDNAAEVEPGDAVASGVGADAAELLLERWRSQDRPVELATLAWALQREFGAEISDDWFGQGSFKRFLHQAVPYGEVSTGRRSYLLPDPDRLADALVTTSPTDETASVDETSSIAIVSDGMPTEAAQLRRVDRGFPLIDTDVWRSVYHHLADAWRQSGRRSVSNQMINQLTRAARDGAVAAGEQVSRRQLDYVARSVLSGPADGGPVNGPLEAQEIGDRFRSKVITRMTDLRILGGDGERADAVAAWLGSGFN